MGIDIRHDETGHRFVATVDGAEALVEYRRPDEATIEYHRTWTPEPLRGRAIAGRIVEAALEYAKTHGLRVVPTCPYVARFIERRAEYRSLFDA